MCAPGRWEARKVWLPGSRGWVVWRGSAAGKTQQLHRAALCGGEGPPSRKAKSR